MLSNPPPFSPNVRFPLVQPKSEKIIWSRDTWAVNILKAYGTAGKISLEIKKKSCNTFCVMHEIENIHTVDQEVSFSHCSPWLILQHYIIHLQYVKLGRNLNFDDLY